jgi:tetratricopeptide (TPR) repeat protein
MTSPLWWENSAFPDRGYNQTAVNRALVVAFAAFLLFPFSADGQTPAVGRTLVVIPFENTSPTPGLEWLGEAFPEAFRQQLNSPVVYVSSRDERLRAYDRLGIPAGLHLSRATLYRLAEQMDVDYALLGTYNYDGARLTATAQLLDMRALKLLPIATESGALTDLGTVEAALAWDTLRQIRNDFSQPKDRFVGSIQPVRLDAFENYVRGLQASTAEEKIRRYKEAVRLNATYAEAWLELGKTYLNQRSYDQAIAALEQIPPTSSVAREANFYLGLAAYYHADFDKSAMAFEFVAARLPLAEVYNNLGVVNLRRGQKDAATYFQRAIANDPSDPDYHFNLGVALSRIGDKSAAVREMRAALQLHPGDSEAKALADAFASAGAGVVPAASSTAKPLERIKRNYEENSYRQMSMQLQAWAEERFTRSDARTHARFHIELGKDLLSHGFTDEAEREFREAANLDSASPAPLTGMAEVFDARGNPREARAQAEAALRVREFAEAYMVLARLDLRENKTEAAAENVKHAVQLEPGNSAAQDLKRAVAARLTEKP